MLMSTNLAMLASVYPTPSGSSVPMEGLFSVTGIIKKARRPSATLHRLKNYALCTTVTMTVSDID